MRESDLAVACEQLALLLRSGLPLPDCLREIGGDIGRGGMREALQRIAKDTADGKTLSAAMGEHPDVFSPDQIAMVSAGEETDSLPDMLAEIAELSLQRQQAANRLREIAAYPLIVCFVAICLYVAMQVLVTPSMGATVAAFGIDIAGGLPAVTLAMSDVLRSIWPVAVGVLAVMGVFGIWLLCSSGKAIRLIARLFTWIPGGGNVVLFMDFSRTCRYLQVLLKRGMPLPDALLSASGIAFDGRWNGLLREWSARHREGMSMTEVVEKMPPPDALIGLALTGPSSEDPGAAFGDLAELYSRRADIASSRFAAFWTALVTLAMFVLVGGTVLSLFAPLIRMLEQLGG